MIGLNIAASVWCDQPGCVAVQPARLVLQGSGGFGAVPEDTAWQVLLASNGTLLARCPKHADKKPRKRGDK